jgi:hypothetical protein
VDRSYRRNAEDAERIRAIIVSDDVSDDDSIDDGTEYDGNYVEPREGDSESAEEATSNDYCCNAMDATESCFHWKGIDVVG